MESPMEPAERSVERTALISDVAAILPGEFHLLDYLGEGGHGIVFKAIFKPLQTQVALKLIKQDDPERMVRELERMQNEARILARLQHPNVIKVFQMAKCTDGTPFLVCEYINGETLSSYLHNSGQMSLDEIKNVFCQILDALKVSHDQGLIHRDIKPNNIMLFKENSNAPLSVKVLDFGIARNLAEAATSGGATTTSLGLTRTIQVTGSAPYMSPEQCRGGQIDPRTDIYSLACVLYECLSGRPPFVGETPIHTRYMHIHEQAKQPSDKTDEHIREKGSLYQLVLKALSKDPKNRPQSAEEFKTELVAACAKSKFSNPNRKHRQPHSISPIRQINVNTLLLAASLMSIVVFGASSLFLLSSKEEKHIKDPSRIESITHKADLNDPEYQLASARNDIETTYRFALAGFESRRLEVRAWEKIDRALPKISKNNKALLFAAWSMKAGLCNPLNLSDQAKHYWETALKYCHQDGKETLEASQCYLGLAKCYLASNKSPADIQLAEANAQRALALRELNEREALPLLPIPGTLDQVRDKISELTSTLEVLGEIASKQGKDEKAIIFFRRAFENQQKNYGTAAAIAQAKLLAAGLYTRNKLEAESFIRRYIDALGSSPDVSLSDYANILTWCQQNSSREFFEECTDTSMEALNRRGYAPSPSEEASFRMFVDLYERNKKNSKK